MNQRRRTDRARWALQTPGEVVAAADIVSDPEGKLAVARFLGGPRDGLDVPYPLGRQFPQRIYTCVSLAHAAELADKPAAGTPCYLLTDATESGAVTYTWATAHDEEDQAEPEPRS
jgi:hypothetical protein